MRIVYFFFFQVYFHVNDNPEMSSIEPSIANLQPATPIEEIISVCKELYVEQFLNRTTTGSLAAFQNFIQGTVSFL